MRKKIVGILFALVLVASLGLVMVPLDRVCAATNSQEFTASGTFVVPARVMKITVEAWGSGGAGGGSTNSGTSRGGAGGGGGARTLQNGVPGLEVLVVVGK